MNRFSSVDVNSPPRMTSAEGATLELIVLPGDKGRRNQGGSRDYLAAGFARKHTPASSMVVAADAQHQEGDSDNKACLA
jgi:hypothetical protein